jgi:hypothetical protein
MKEVKSTQSVENVVTMYVCEHPGCDFSTDSGFAARRHTGLEHSFTKSEAVYGAVLLFFPSVETVRLWEATNGEASVTWKGQGWYAAIEDDEDPRSPYLVDIAGYLQQQQDEYEGIGEAIQSIKRLISETKGS